MPVSNHAGIKLLFIRYISVRYKLIHDLECADVWSHLKVVTYVRQYEHVKTTAEVPRMRAETSLLVAEYGGWDIARKHLMRQADALTEARRKIQMITTHPLYRLIRPIYKWLTRK